MREGVRSWRERGLQTLWFEGVGLAIVAPLYGWAAGAGASESFSLVGALSGVVMAWSAVFNTGFDIVEFRLTARVASARPRWLRVVHAIGLETTAIGITVPVIYAMSNYSWMQALQADVALTLAYVAYAYVFHGLYDRWRPVSARPSPRASNHGPCHSLPLIASMADLRHSLGLSRRAPRVPPNPGERTMNRNAIHPRLARLQRECDVSLGPVLLLCAACAVFVLMLCFGTLLDETASVRAAEPAEQTTLPTT